MTDDTNSYTQAEIVRLLQRVSREVGELRTDLKRLEGNYVSRAEWEMWKETHERPKTSPWGIAGVIVSAVVGLGSLLTLAIFLIQTIK